MTHKIEVDSGTRYVTATWVLASGEAGDAAQLSRLSKKVVHMFGPFATGTVNLEGSPDQINWAPLHEVNSVAPIALTSAGLRGIAENPRFIRPVASTAVGLSVTVVVGGAPLE